VKFKGGSPISGLRNRTALYKNLELKTDEFSKKVKNWSNSDIGSETKKLASQACSDIPPFIMMIYPIVFPSMV
jgi:hypothetical protein